MSNVASWRIPTSVSRLPVRLLLALMGAGLAYLVFPRTGIWPLIVPMIVLIYAAGSGLRFWKGAFVGLVAGVTFFASQTFWLSQYLGPEPLIVLAGGEGIIFAFFFGGSTLVASTIRERFAKFASPAVLASVFAIFWVAREWFSGTFPYGGFPWAKLVMSQSDTVLSRWVWLGGMPLADFVIAFVIVFALETLITGRGVARYLTPLAATAALILVPFILPISTSAEVGTVKVAGVQGNANAGLFTNREAGKIFENHIAGTEKLLKSGKPFDLVVWPENAVDLDLFGNPTNFRTMQNLVDKINKPLIFGTITQREALFNSSILWEPRLGKTDWYDKKRPVPFAEYVPDRPFWYWVSPDLISLISYDYAFGTRDGIFEVDQKKYGTLICFEIAIDQISRDLVSSGAQVILSQTNNADFGKSDEAYQQLAIARLRAIETGRALVNISTVGPSAIYLPDGSQVQYLNSYTRDYVVANLPLRNSKTPAFYLASPIELTAAAVSAFLFIVALFKFRIRGKK